MAARRGGARPTPATVAVTTSSLPDEVLAVVFGYCDARTRMMALPR